MALTARARTPLLAGLAAERLFLLRERVDAFTCGTGRLLDDDELCEARPHEDPCLLQLLSNVSDVASSSGATWSLCMNQNADDP
jgi:hypothetical protein